MAPKQAEFHKALRNYESWLNLLEPKDIPKEEDIDMREYKNFCDLFGLWLELKDKDGGYFRKNKHIALLKDMPRPQNIP
jgi:hypothetical protein